MSRHIERAADPLGKDPAKEGDRSLTGVGNAHGHRVQVNEQAQNEVIDQTIQETQATDPLLEEMMNRHPEKEVHDADEPKVDNDLRSFDNNPNTIHLEKVAKTERMAKTITEEFCKKIPSDYANSSPDLKNKAFVITSEDTERLLNHPEYRESVGVLDLRDPGRWVDDFYSEKIPGALEYPLVEDGFKVASWKVELGEPMPVFWKFDARRAQNWAKELQRPDSPFQVLARKAVVIIHCRESVNRAPVFANGYLRYVAEPRGQRVLLLQGGFQEYRKTAKAEHVAARDKA